MKIKKTFLAAIFTISTNALAGGPGAIECYSYAKYHTDLSVPGVSTDEAAIAQLCYQAIDDTPATCYDQARHHADASKDVAILLCKPLPLCTLPDGRLFQIPRKSF